MKKILLILFLATALYGCESDRYNPGNALLKKIKNGDYITEQILYNNSNLVSEDYSTLMYQKFSYDNNSRLVRVDIAISPDAFSSLYIPGLEHELVDPSKTPITFCRKFEYDQNGRLSRQLNYVPSGNDLEYRSMRTFEYNDKNLISKVLSYNDNGNITQFDTYEYDSNGNVTVDEYYSYMLAPQGSDPQLVIRTEYEFDSFLNPFRIFNMTGMPGIFSNTNNITRTTSHTYFSSPEVTETEYTYEYDHDTRYPVRITGGEEYIYD